MPKKEQTIQEKILQMLEIGEIGALRVVLGGVEGLDLSCSKLTDTHALFLAEVLKSNNTLTKLNLRGNQIGGIGGKAIWEAIETNFTLKSFNLAYNQIGDPGAQVIGKGLEHNSALEDLNLEGNQIGDVGGGAIGKGLENNSTLAWLSLYGNQIGDIGGGTIGKGLENNSTLKHFNLAFNQIGDTGGEVIGKGLEHNSTLTHFSLWGNKIGNEGAKAIGQWLVNNSTLAWIGLQENQIGDAGGAAIAEALRTNYNLPSITIWGNQIGEERENVIRKLVARNKALATYKAKFSTVQEQALQAIESDSIDIGEVRKLLYQRQFLITKNPAPEVFTTENTQINAYISENYLELIEACKHVNEDSPMFLLLGSNGGLDCMVRILSYLPPTSLFPELLPRTELSNQEIEPKIEFTGDIETSSIGRGEWCTVI